MLDDHHVFSTLSSDACTGLFCAGWKQARGVFLSLSIMPDSVIVKAPEFFTPAPCSTYLLLLPPPIPTLLVSFWFGRRVPLRIHSLVLKTFIMVSKTVTHSSDNKQSRLRDRHYRSPPGSSARSRLLRRAGVKRSRSA